MAEAGQVDDIETSEESNVKTGIDGLKEFKGAVERRDPMAPHLTPAPAGIPEKFWDPVEGKLRTEDLVKSYQALEEKLGKPKADEDDEPKEGDEPNEGDEPKEEDEPKEDDEPNEGDEPKEEDEEDEASPSDFQAAMEAAQKTYAETGELPDEQRKPFLDMGFTSQQIDFYLSGVKATEAALASTAHKAAGGEDAYKAATEWAAKNWTEKQILAFNAQTGDVETIGTAVAGLMAAYRKAEPGEGKLQNINSGITHGDVYTDHEEFQQDLDEADRLRDNVKRRKAIAKLRRSREAGTIKAASRKQPFGS